MKTKQKKPFLSWILQDLTSTSHFILYYMYIYNLCMLESCCTHLVAITYIGFSGQEREDSFRQLTLCWFVYMLAISRAYSGRPNRAFRSKKPSAALIDKCVICQVHIMEFRPRAQQWYMSCLIHVPIKYHYSCVDRFFHARRVDCSPTPCTWTSTRGAQRSWTRAY